jgi:acetyl esterase/lipase
MGTPAVAVLTTLALSLAGGMLLVPVSSSARSRPLAPGLYDGHPPRGIVSANNTFTIPAHPKGIVMVVHGGGWVLVGKKDLETVQSHWFLAHGYGVYDIDYRADYDSLVDVVAAYDWLRGTVGSNTELCAYGASAGGHLVQLLAASRPSLDCLISEAGIEDVRAIPNQCAYGNVCGALTTSAYWAWGTQLWQFSPVRVARYITQPFIAGGSSFDPLIDESAQLAAMKRVRPTTETMLLSGSASPSGQSENFMHASVTQLASARWHNAVLQLLRGSVHESLYGHR